MVVLNRIYTRTGDGGETALSDGSRVGKDSASRVPVQIAPSDDPARVEILSGAATGDTLIAPSAGARP